MGDRIQEETLSITQASKMVEQANESLSTCKNEIETKINDFLSDMSRIWEDKNAVELAVNINTSYQRVLKTMTKNIAEFANNLQQITTLYLKLGAMPEKLTTEPAKFSGELNYNVVKEYFKDSENGDDFGFKDVKQSPQLVMNSFEILRNKLQIATSEMIGSLDKIRAFGNSNVKMEVAKSAGSIVNIITQEIEAMRNDTKEKLMTTAAQYSGASVAATEAAAYVARNVENSN